METDLERIWVVKKAEDESGRPVNLGLLMELNDDGDESALREHAHSLIPGSRLLDVDTPPNTKQNLLK